MPKTLSQRPHARAQDAMLREFQQEIAKLKAQLEAAGDSHDDSVHSRVTGASGGPIAQAAGMELDVGDVERLRPQFDAELQSECGGGSAELDGAALAQMQREVEVQVAEQVKQVQEEKQRAATEAARLQRQLHQQSTQVQRVAERKEQERAQK